MKVPELQVVGLDYTCADPELRARTHLTTKKVEEIYQQYLGNDDFIILSTCNRTELYYTSTVNIEAVLPEIFGGSLPEDAYHYQGAEALLHLLELAVGLRSMIIGETEILGQIKSAWQLRRNNEATPSTICNLFRTIVSQARHIRAKTKIGGYSASLYTLVIRELKRELKEFKDGPVLILGNGLIAQKMAQAFLNHHVATTILTRTQKADSTFRPQPMLPGVRTVLGYQHLNELLASHSVIVTATTAPHYLVKLENAELLRGKVLIDLSFPRNIDPQLRLACDHFWDLDHFGAIAAVNTGCKNEAVALAKTLCVEALGRMQQKSTILIEDQNKQVLVG